MKCFAQASSAEALDATSFPFHSAIWKEICYTFFCSFQPSLSWFHTWCKLHDHLIQQSQTKLPVVKFVSKAQKEQKMNSEC